MSSPPHFRIVCPVLLVLPHAIGDSANLDPKPERGVGPGQSEVPRGTSRSGMAKADSRTLVKSFEGIRTELRCAAAIRTGRKPIFCKRQTVLSHHRRGVLTEIPGIGDAIADIITKLDEAGTQPSLEKLRKEVPAGILQDLGLHRPRQRPLTGRMRSSFAAASSWRVSSPRAGANTLQIRVSRSRAIFAGAASLLRILPFVAWRSHRPPPCADAAASRRSARWDQRVRKRKAQALSSSSATKSISARAC